jgi:hypothetical protein
MHCPIFKTVTDHNFENCFCPMGGLVGITTSCHGTDPVSIIGNIYTKNNRYSCLLTITLQIPSLKNVV